MENKKTSGASQGQPASELISKRIAELGDWRGETLSRMRNLIKKADPEVVEEWKWRGTPVWSHDGIICTGEFYKRVVKLTFAKGASLKDPTRLFNSSLEGNVRRAIDIHEGEKVAEAAFRAGTSPFGPSPYGFASVLGTHCTGTATTLPSACQQAAQIRPRQVTRIRETHQEIVAQRPDQVERRQNVAPGERASSRLPGDGNSAGLCRAAERAAARCVHPRGKVRWTGPAGAATVAWTFGVPRTLRWRNANAPAARSSQGYSNFLVAQTGNIPAGNGTFLAAHGHYATSAEKPNDSGSYRFLDSETVECSNAASQTVTWKRQGKPVDANATAQSLPEHAPATLRPGILSKK